MYNFDFLDKLKNNNTIILFHNETVDVEGNIISDIASFLSDDLKVYHPERSTEESLIILQYPSIDSTEYTFNQFFDSPRCASIMFSSFKGVFIVDCSKYTSIDNPQFNKLLEYINENAASDFKFIVLMSSQCKRQYMSMIKNKNNLIIDLEISLSQIEFYKEYVDKKSYSYLIEQFNNNLLFRQLSALQIENCINCADCSKDDFVKTVTKTINENDCIERRIGF